MKQNEQILRDFMQQVWNERKIELVDTYIAPNYTIHSDPGDPWDGQTIDHAGFINRLQVSGAPFPDLRFELEDLISDEDRVVVSWTMHGTNSGPLGEQPATNKKISVKGLTIYYFSIGKITGHKQVLDRLAVAQQLDMF